MIETNKEINNIQGKDTSKFIKYFRLRQYVHVEKNAKQMSAENNCNCCKGRNSGFGGLEVACWLLVPKFAGSNPAEAIGFLRGKKKNPQHAFLRRGSKAVGPIP